MKMTLTNYSKTWMITYTNLHHGNEDNGTLDDEYLISISLDQLELGKLITFTSIHLMIMVQSVMAIQKSLLPKDLMILGLPLDLISHP